LNGNAHVWVNRVGQEVRELLPLDPGSVSMNVDQSRLGGAVSYTLYGTPMPAGAIWHLKGPSWLSWDGMSTLNNARAAIGLSRATQSYGANLFKNGARPGGILNPTGAPLTPEQVAELKAMWSAQATGVGNAHKTILLTAPVDYTPLASNANDAQWIESRRFQIEEVCRFFRVSPTKAFQQIGSQSYASVEQSHLAHDQDTDAHWHTRFVQSANKALLTDKERASGLTISIDNRDFLRGTAKERMEYYKMGIEVGMFTRNEAREMEGFGSSDDPSADVLTPAVNLFGPDKAKPVVE
ncbi:MAG: phage portal protein, partial [Rhizorhabdus sp.]